ncbi:MAG TPA: glycosyl transferase family 1, partial [Clostridia bacterium]|nr:glycosyl transferase family 1 [Clostridia bacterium]
MKILHINSYFAESTFYKNLFDSQVQNGLDIDVFVPVSSSYNKIGANHGKYTTISKNHGKNDRLLFHLKHSKILKDVVRQYKINEYSIVHAHSL